MIKIIYVPIFVTAMLLVSVSSVDALYYSCSSGESIKTTHARVNGNNLQECAIKGRSGGPNSSQETNFEETFKFNSSDKHKSATKSYNCHGLAYDKRYSWINYPNNILREFVNNSLTAGSISSAQTGDRGIILEESSNGKWTVNGKGYKIIHSWIFSENYHGLNTGVKSKYGSYGEYHHTLRDVYKVYAWQSSTSKVGLVLKYNDSNFTYMRNPNKNIKINSNELNKSTYSQDLSRFSDIITEIELPKDNDINIEFQKTSSKNIDFSLYQTKDLISTIEDNDLQSFYLSSSSDLYRHFGEKNPKIKELYNRIDNGEKVKEMILEMSKKIDDEEKLGTLKQLHNFIQ